MSGVTDIVKEKMRLQVPSANFTCSKSSTQVGVSVSLWRVLPCPGREQSHQVGHHLHLISSRWKIYKVSLVMGNLRALFFGPCFRMFNFENLVEKVKIKCPSLLRWLHYRYQRHHILCSWEHLLVLWRQRLMHQAFSAIQNNLVFAFHISFATSSTTPTIHRIARNTFTFWCIHFSLFRNYINLHFHFLMHSLFLSIAIIFTCTLQTENW